MRQFYAEFSHEQFKSRIANSQPLSESKQRTSTLIQYRRVFGWSLNEKWKNRFAFFEKHFLLLRVASYPALPRVNIVPNHRFNRQIRLT